MALNEITTSAVVRAIEEFDALGGEVFLSRHGFGEARSYHLLYDGRRYPSKAIVGVAHGFSRPDLGPLRSTEFSGGDSTVGALLRGLGFEVLGPPVVEKAESRQGELIERSPEMMVTAYYLARCGVPTPGKADAPPAALGADSWTTAYEVFFDSMGDGRSLGQFRNSLKNARDTFDALFDNGRIGWKDAQGRQPELSGRFARIHEERRSRSNAELETFVLKLAGVKEGGEETLSETMFSRTEGGERVFTSKRRERDSTLRRQAIAIHGLDCMVCSFNFAAAYGEQGDGFIEVHHVAPLSDTGITQTDPRTDLTVVCANCHRMLHRKRGICLSLDELRRHLGQDRQAT